MRALSTAARRRALLARSLVLLAVALGLHGLARAAEDSLAGWHLALDTGERVVHAHAETPALALEPDAAPHPAVGASGWTATWRGALALDRPGRARFGLAVEGGHARLAVRLADAPPAVLECPDGETRALELVLAEPGEVVVTVELVRGDARAPLRLEPTWSFTGEAGAGFPEEAIPARAVRVPAAMTELVRPALDARAGRVLLERMRCTRCHEPSAAQAEAVGSLAGPDLAEIGARASVAWLREKLTEPAAHRPGADMPALFAAGDPRAAEEIEDLVHLLAGARAGGSELDGARASDREIGAGDERRIAAGRELYHTLGCVVCHAPTVSPAELFHVDYLPTELPAAEPLVGFDALGLHWTRPALAAYLRDPARVHPAGRMPSFLLAEDEADALALFLLASFDGPGAEPAEASAVDPEKRERGKLAWTRRRCGACHEGGADWTGAGMPAQRVPGLDALARAVAAGERARGCLDPVDRDTPRYPLDEAQRARLTRALAELATVSGAPAPPDRAARTFEILDCARCHRRGEAGGVAEALRPYFVCFEEEAELGDEGRIPPLLSGVGAKLATGWLHRVVTEGARARPYFAARMPVFGYPAVATLAADLAQADGALPHADLAGPTLTDSGVQAGVKLLGRTGLACITCHLVGERPPAGTAGMDLTAMAGRLRYEWFRRYLRAPDRYKPGTRMPSFVSADGAGFPGILAGDAAAQIDALWACLTLDDNLPVPDGVPSAEGTRLAVGARPLVFRTFLPEAGSRGIAVGFPAGLHVAFDGARARLVRAWQGAFLDADAAWEGRGGQVARGQGPEVWRAPEGAALALVPAGTDAWPARAPSTNASTGADASTNENAGASANANSDASTDAGTESADGAGAVREPHRVAEAEPERDEGRAGRRGRRGSREREVAGGADDGLPAPSFHGYRLDPAGVPTFRYTVRGVDAAGAEVRVAVEETVRPYPREGVLFARELVVASLPEGTALLWRAGAGARLAFRPAAALGETAVERLADGLFRMTGGPVTVVVEVTR